MFDSCVNCKANEETVRKRGFVIISKGHEDPYIQYLIKEYGTPLLDYCAIICNECISGFKKDPKHRVRLVTSSLMNQYKPK